MSEIITCPNCRRKLQAPDEFLGKEAICPSCQSRFVAALPNLSSTTPPPSVQLGTEVFEPTTSAEPLQVDAVFGAAQATNLDSHLSHEQIRRQRRLDNSRRPKPRNRARGLFVALGVVALFSAGLVWMMWPRTERNFPVANIQGFPGPLLELNERQRAAMLKAFENQAPLRDEDIKQEVQRLFQELGMVRGPMNQVRFAGLLDLDRMFDELQALELVPPAVRRERRDFFLNARAGLSRTEERQIIMHEWDQFEIKHVKKLQGNEAVLLIRHRHPTGIMYKMRWWVSKRSGSWRVFDAEELDVGLRISATISAWGDLAIPQHSFAALEDVIEAMLAVTLQRNLDEAERRLSAWEGKPLPRRLDAIRQLATARRCFDRFQGKEAIAALDEVQRLDPEAPALDYLRAIAWNLQGDFGKALKHINDFRALVGEDSFICYEVARARHGLQHLAGARAMYRMTLDFDPNHREAFLGLIRTLGPGDQRDDLSRRFHQMARPHESFDILAEDCRQGRDAASLELLAQAMQAIDRNHESATYYLGLAKLWLGKIGEAEPLFRTVFLKENNPVKRQTIVQDYVQGMVDRGQALSAYAAMPNPQEAFRQIATDLKHENRTAELRKLLALHGKKHREDRLLPFFEGEVDLQEGRYDKADKTFTAAMARPPEAEQLDLFRPSRVLARHRLGKSLSAYAEIGPRRLTFQQLAALAWEEGRDSILEQLVQAHSQVDPDDESLFFYQVTLAIRHDKPDDASARLKTELAKEPLESRRQRLISDFAHAMVEAGKSFDAYEAIPDSPLAFRLIANDLRQAGNDSDLKKLLDLHGKRHPDDIELRLQMGQSLLDVRHWDKAAAVFAQGMKLAPQQLREAFRNLHTFATYKSGRGLEAFRADPSRASFSQLAALMIQDRRVAELETLIAAYRPHASDDTDWLMASIRGKILAGKAHEAIQLIQAHGPQLLHLNALQMSQIVLDFHDVDQGLEAFQVLPDQSLVFKNLAPLLVQDKKTKQLEQLLEAYAQKHPSDPWLLLERGEWHLLRGQALQADVQFTAALAKAPIYDQWTFRNGMLRARVQAGKTVATYQELGAGRRVFEELATACVAVKNELELAALLETHRRAVPLDPVLPAWDLEILWLRKDYAGALKLLSEQRDLFVLPQVRWKAADYQVRALIQTQRLDAAIWKAEAFAKRKRLNHVTLILAHAATGNVKQTLAAMDKLRPQPFFVATCYRDPDLGPLLRGVEFAAFRAMYPERAGSGVTAVH